MSKKENAKRYLLFIVCLFFYGARRSDYKTRRTWSFSDFFACECDQSLVFFDGQLYGTREGTIISALFVGVTVKFFRKALQRPLDRILKNEGKNLVSKQIRNNYPICKVIIQTATDKHMRIGCCFCAH